MQIGYNFIVFNEKFKTCTLCEAGRALVDSGEIHVPFGFVLSHILFKGRASGPNVLEPI